MRDLSGGKKKQLPVQARPWVKPNAQSVRARMTLTNLHPPLPTSLFQGLGWAHPKFYKQQSILDALNYVSVFLGFFTSSKDMRTKIAQFTIISRFQ